MPPPDTLPQIILRVVHELEAVVKALLDGLKENNVKTSPRLDFARKILDAMSRVDMKGIYPPIALAVFDLETGSGTGDIFQHTNNPGSIKSTVGWSGKASYKETRAYGTLEEGIADWVRLISGSPRYQKAYAAMHMRDFKGAFVELEKAGYEVALDPPYSSRLLSRYEGFAREGIA